MELTETIQSLNTQLVDLFGIDTATGRPIWRIVWSEDQFEKRLVDTTDEGLFLLHPVVKEVPRYRQWIKEKYVLERLVGVPEINRKELLEIKMSYEPLWVFRDVNDNYLPPRIDVAKFVIDLVYATEGKRSMRKYIESPETSEEKDLRIQKLQDELFGDETAIGDALAHKYGVVVPRNYTKEN